jgi:hypothetical protein
MSSDALYKCMANETRTANVMVRMTPSLKAAAENAAKDDTRSLSSLIEKLLVEHLKAEGYRSAPSASGQTAQGVSDARAMAHRAIDKATAHSGQPTRMKDARKRSLTEMPEGLGRAKRPN